MYFQQEMIKLKLKITHNRSW